MPVNMPRISTRLVVAAVIASGAPERIVLIQARGNQKITATEQAAEPHAICVVGRRKGMPVMPAKEAERLRFLAMEALAVAAQMEDLFCKGMMLDVAASYETLADHAEKRETARSGDDALAARPRPPLS